MSDFNWTAQRLQAAHLVAEDRLTNDKIAADLDIGVTTLKRWKGDPAFVAKVDEIIAAAEVAVRRRAIAQRAQRVEAKQRRWRALEQITQERSEDPTMANVPGGTTGHIVRQLRMIGAGPSAQMVEEYVVDAALLSEMRQLEKEAAQELGQWAEKRDTTVTLEGSDALDTLKSRLARLAATRAAGGGAGDAE